MMEKERTTKVEFRGRTLEVRAPTPEQIMLINRMTAQFKSGGVMGGEQAVQLLDQALVVVESVLVSNDDVIWIKDEMLRGRTGIVECSSIMSEAVKKLWPKATPKDHLKKTPKAKLTVE